MIRQNIFNSKEKLSLKDKATFNFVFNDYYKPLVLFASSFLNNEKDISEDMVQDVFTNLLQTNKKFNNLTALKAFLYISVRNTCLNYYKHKKVRHLYSEEKKATGIKEVFFLNKVLEEEIYSHLVTSVSQLPKKCRKIFEYSLVGMRNSEIASNLKISIETVKSQKKRGKKLLKKMIGPILYYAIPTFNSK